MANKKYELDISNYLLDVPKGTPGRKTAAKTKKGNEQEDEPPVYETRLRLRDLLLHPALQLNGAQVYARIPFVQRIVECEADTVALSKQEFSLILQSFERLTGFNRLDAPLIQRVYDLKQIFDADEKKREAKEETAKAEGD